MDDSVENCQGEGGWEPLHEDSITRPELLKSTTTSVEQVPRLAVNLRIQAFDVVEEEPRYLVEADGAKSFCVSSKMRDLIEAIDGRSTTAEIAASLSTRWGRSVSASQIQTIVQTRLVTVGVVEAVTPGLTNSKTAKRNRLIRFRLAIPILSKEWAARLCSPLTFLFAPASVAAGLIAILASRLLIHGPWFERTQSPLNAEEYVAFIVLVALTTVAHELGHGTAVARWNGGVGAMGVTLFFIYPALYTDTRGAWRLSRRQRIAVDAGGAYFQMLSSVPIAVLSFATGRSSYWLACASIDALVVLSAVPFLRFDGYWVLADALGLPDLQERALRLFQIAINQLVKRGPRSVVDLVGGRLRNAVILVYGLLFQIVYSTVLIWTLMRSHVWLTSYWEQLCDIVQRPDWVSARGTVQLGEFVLNTAVMVGLFLFWKELLRIGKEQFAPTATRLIQWLKRPVESIVRRSQRITTHAHDHTPR